LICVSEVRPMVLGVQLKEPGVRDVFGQVASCLDRCYAITARMDDEGGNPDRGEDVTDVEQHVHPHPVLSVAGTGAHLPEGRPPASDFSVVDLAGGVAIHAGDLAPDVPDAAH